MAHDCAQFLAALLEQSRIFQRRAIISCLLAAAGLCCRAADAAPEEIQVFTDDVQNVGAIGLELHTNYVLSGSSTINYPGAEQSTRRLRLAPEMSIGVLDRLQIGVLTPLATLDRSGHFDLGGAKLTAKYIVPSTPAARFWYGANLEVGRTDRRLDINPWNAELTGIVGTRRGPWLVAFNLVVDLALAGPRCGPADLAFAAKVSRVVSQGLAIGVESYNGAGNLKTLGRFDGGAQSLFAIADLAVGRWDLNVGLGRGYGANSDRWLMKAVLGIPLGTLHRHGAR